MVSCVVLDQISVDAVLPDTDWDVLHCDDLISLDGMCQKTEVVTGYVLDAVQLQQEPVEVPVVLEVVQQVQ